MRPEHKAEYRAFVAANLDRLQRFAFLNCGDWHRGEDAVQTALVKLYVAWPRARRYSLESYVRRIIVNVLIDESRLSRFRREKPSLVIPDAADTPADRTERLRVLSALSQLPPRQRATVILRFWEDQSVEQTAKVLGCSANTVKTQTARGLDTLRRLLNETKLDHIEGIIA